MAAGDKKTALVFGASGVSGWAVVNQLLSYPTPTTFSRIIALTNRPLEIEDSFWPQGDNRLEAYNGINLRDELDTVKEQLRTKVPKLEEVTHVYYCAYSNATAYSIDVMEIRDINVKMTGNAVRAIDEVCTNLQFWVLQTGTNHYGVAVFRFEDKIPLTLPLRESQPRVPSPWGDEIFYYGQVDLIKEVQKGKSWKWCDVRPDGISGFTASMSAMNWLEPIALFLALWRYINGPGAEIKFIGTTANYLHTNTDSCQDTIARSEIYLSVIKPDESNGEGFNTADYDTPVSWIQRWPIMAGYFGLKGVGPDEGQDTVFPVDQWWKEHEEDYKRMCTEYGLVEREIPSATWIFTLVAGFNLLKRNREVSLDKIRAIGFTEELPIGGGQIRTLERLSMAKRLPPKEAMQEGTSGQ